MTTAPPGRSATPWVGARLAAAVVAGMLLAASLPPWPVATGAWPLGLIGAAVLYAATEGAAGRARLACGLAAGLGLYVPGLWWMRDFSLPGYLVATVVEAGFLAAGAALVPGRAGWRRALAFPAALVLVEAVRGAWPFGGLPISGIDLGQVGGPLAGAARLGGRLLLVALVGAGGVALAEAARRRWQAASVAIGVVVLVGAAGAVAPDGRPDGRLSVATVQGGGPRGVRAILRDPGPVFDRQIQATAGVNAPIDLVLWPEDVVDVEAPVATTPEATELATLARSLGTTLVAGVVEDVGGVRFHNAAVAWGPDGTLLDRYEKVHRVPFGEYAPGRRLLGTVFDLSEIPRDAIAGHGPPTLDTPAGRLGVVISYEVFFGDRTRDAVRHGGRLLLVPTNASSYRDAQVPAQEVAAARLRALETGRWLVQAAPTGYSAIVDQRGRVHGRSGLGGPAVLRSEVGLRTGSTVFVATGPSPVVLLAVALLLISMRKPEWLARRFVDENPGEAVS
ncbi:MAG TPA: apolipoprotein N-acyltransferase [Acidimicrobiales bacterium]|nr:apolipoprotein N-acyltransferase [Acidimicrobiales bacterium]